MNTTTTPLEGYKVGTWDIDNVHSDVSFSVRHMMVSKVRGHFRNFSGTVETGTDPTQSKVVAVIDLRSLETNNPDRDTDVRSANYFDVDQFPEMKFESTEIHPNGDDWTLVGNLTLRGVTKPVELDLENHGFRADPWGGYRGGFSAKGEINRKDFGISFDIPMDGGGLVVGDKIQVNLEIETVLRDDS